MKITDIKTTHYKLPLPSQIRDAGHGKMNNIELIRVIVKTNSHIEGEGYAYTLGQGGKAIRAMIEYDLKPILIDKNAFAIKNIYNKMWWHIHWVGRGGISSFAIAAIDIALWDLKAKAEDKPLYKILGGDKKDIIGYGSLVDLSFDDNKLLNRIESFVEDGFNAIKIKVGRNDFDKDLKKIKLIYDNFGYKVKIMIDANMGWNVKDTLLNVKKLDNYNIEWLEEPLIPEDVKGYSYLKKIIDIPIATGENLHSSYEFQRYFEADALNVAQLDVITVGGITEWLRVASIARANNIPISTHFAEEIHVHLLAAISNASYCEKHMYRLESYIKNPIKVKKGKFVLPENPGHGAHFIEDTLKPYQVY